MSTGPVNLGASFQLINQPCAELAAAGQKDLTKEAIIFSEICESNERFHYCSSQALIQACRTFTGSLLRGEVADSSLYIRIASAIESRFSNVMVNIQLQDGTLLCNKIILAKCPVLKCFFKEGFKEEGIPEHFLNTFSYNAFEKVYASLKNEDWNNTWAGDELIELASLADYLGLEDLFRQCIKEMARSLSISAKNFVKFLEFSYQIDSKPLRKKLFAFLRRLHDLKIEKDKDGKYIIRTMGKNLQIWDDLYESNFFHFVKKIKLAWYSTNEQLNWIASKNLNIAKISLASDLRSLNTIANKYLITKLKFSTIDCMDDLLMSKLKDGLLDGSPVCPSLEGFENLENIGMRDETPLDFLLYEFKMNHLQTSKIKKLGLMASFPRPEDSQSNIARLLLACPKLKKLSLGSCNSLPLVNGQLAKHSAITALTLNIIENEDFKKFSNLKSLKHLSLNASRLENDAVRMFAHANQNIVRLALYTMNRNITDQTLSYLIGRENGLTDVRLECPSIGSDTYLALSKLPAIKKITIEKHQINTQELIILLAAPSLQALSLPQHNLDLAAPSDGNLVMSFAAKAGSRSISFRETYAFGYIAKKAEAPDGIKKLCGNRLKKLKTKNKFKIILRSHVPYLP